jgi:hypothetical protein
MSTKDTLVSAANRQVAIGKRASHCREAKYEPEPSMLEYSGAKRQEALNRKNNGGTRIREERAQRMRMYE